MAWSREAFYIEDQTASRAQTSILRYSPALILIVIAVADIQHWADPDLWGHVAFGRAMIATGHLATRDPYSYSAPGHLWLNHEWLSELLMGAMYNALGVIGLKLMKLACAAAIIFSLALGMAETDSPPMTQFAILMIASVAIGPQIQFRPQLFTFVMFSGLLAILARWNYRRRASVWLAIPMLALWANLHGGFIIGLATLATFSAAVWFEDIVEHRGNRRAIWLLAISVASTVATLATPYGIGTWHAVAHAMMNPHTGAVVVDWQSLPKSFLAQWEQNHVGAIYILLALAMFAALATTFILSPRGGDLPLVAIAVLMVAAAFIALRNLPLAVIATVIPLARHWSLALSLTPPPSTEVPRDRTYWINQVALTTVAAVLLIGTGLFSTSLRAGDPRPVGAISFMKRHRLNGNILADFGWGEYVIWHMAPTSKVFIDGRYDTVYPSDVIDDYLALHYGEARGKDLLTKYPHDFILLSPNDEPALKLIAGAPGWKQIYRDSSCTLFVRADSAAAKIPPTTLSANETPASHFP